MQGKMKPHDRALAEGRILQERESDPGRLTDGIPAEPLTYVVVLVWNGREDTLRCLGSLEAAAGERTRVVVVDNGSVDGSPAAVRERFPWVEVIETGENLGFTGGNNVGIRHALDRGADYVLLLNNDTEVDPSFVSEMLAVARKSPGIGFVSPKIYFFEPRDLIWFAGARFSTRTGYGRVRGYRETDRGQYDKEVEIARPCGCALLATRRLCEEVGLLDPGIFLYGDEVEWMLRARKKGYAAWYAPKAKVWHKVSASVGSEDHPNTFYYCVRNTLYLLRAHASYRFPPLNWIRDFVVAGVFLLALLRSRAPKGKGLRAIRDGIADSLRGVMGPRPR